MTDKIEYCINEIAKVVVQLGDSPVLRGLRDTLQGVILTLAVADNDDPMETDHTLNHLRNKRPLDDEPHEQKQKRPRVDIGLFETSNHSERKRPLDDEPHEQKQKRPRVDLFDSPSEKLPKATNEKDKETDENNFFVDEDGRKRSNNFPYDLIV